MKEKTREKPRRSSSDQYKNALTKKSRFCKVRTYPIRVEELARFSAQQRPSSCPYLKVNVIEM